MDPGHSMQQTHQLLYKGLNGKRGNQIYQPQVKAGALLRTLMTCLTSFLNNSQETVQGLRDAVSCKAHSGMVGPFHSSQSSNKLLATPKRLDPAVAVIMSSMCSLDYHNIILSIIP